MAEYRSDYTNRPRDEWGLPGVKYPTPNIADVVIVEDVPIRQEGYEPVPYGTAHPKDATALLIWQGEVRGNSQDAAIRRIYATQRIGQDAYNYALKYVGESAAHRTYIRSYLKLRSQYTEAPRGVELRFPITGINIDFQGGNITSGVILGFTDATGTGAQALVTVGGGIVTKVEMLFQGDHYSPDVDIDVTALADFMPQFSAQIEVATDVNALLVKEEAEPAEGEYASLFLRVTRIYKTLPGPPIISRRWGAGGTQILRVEQDVLADQALSTAANMMLERIDGVSSVESKLTRETLTDSGGNGGAEGAIERTIEVRDAENQVTIFTTFTIIAAATVLPVEGTPYKTGYVIGARKLEIEGSPKMIREVTWCALPPPRVEFPSLSWQFPGILTILNPNWFNLEGSLFVSRPWMGIDVEYIEPRTKKITGRLIYHFTLGPTSFLPVVYRVTTPGTGSKAYKMIKENSIHPDLKHFSFDSLGNSVQTEKIPRSTPSTYDDYDILIADAEAKVWKGRFYLRTILQISESLNAQNFPSMYFPVPFFAEGGDIINRMADLGYPDTGTKLTLYSTNAGDTTQGAGIQGKVIPTNLGGHPEVGIESVQLNGTTRVSTTQEWWKVHEVKLTATAVGTVIVLGASLPNAGSVTFVGIPADGDTFTIQRNATSRTYTFKRSEETILTVGANAAGLNNTGAEADYFAVIRRLPDNSGIESVAFWFNGNSAAPPIEPVTAGTTRYVEVVIPDTAATTAEVLAPLKAAVEADGGWFVYQYAGVTNAIHLFDKFLANQTDAFKSPGIPAPYAVASVNGSAIAANQIRIIPTSTGAAGTNPENALALAAALTNSQAQVDAAILLGQVGSATTALAFSPNGEALGDVVEISSDEYFEPGAETWTLTKAGTQITLDQVDGGEDGPEVTRILPGSLSVYRDVDFWNPGLTDNNVPAGVNLTTNAIATGNRPVLLTYRAHGKPGIPVTYDVSENGTAWTAGAQNGTMKKAGREIVRTITPELTYSAAPVKNVNYIRLHVDNTVSAFVRQMHAAILINYTD